MKTTTNYQLNQWDPGDRLLRTDFNGDNGKIDAAIKAAETAAKDAVAAEATARGTAITTLTGKVTAVEGKAGAQLIRSVVTSANATSTNIYISDVNWDAWHTVYVSVDPVTTNSGTLGIYLNGSTSTELSGVSGNPGGSHSNFCALIFYPLFEARRRLVGLALSDYKQNLLYFSTSFQNFSYIQLVGYSGNQVLAGTRVSIWGVK